MLQHVKMYTCVIPMYNLYGVIVRFMTISNRDINLFDIL